ncbi:putative cyclase-associated protein CAP/septum formation inhibitor MinC [Helianthus debilis subsp. tardiflorus]
MDENLLKRLEVAVVRLESLSGGSQPQTVASASSEPSIVAFDDLIAEYVGKVSAAAEKIGGHVKDITNVVSDAFRVQKELLVEIKRTQKPDAGGMAEFLKPLNEKLTEAHMKAGSHSGFSNHLKSTAESLTALAWIAYTGKDCGMSMPIGHVEECWQSAEFYSNKVLVEYKNKDSNHVEWAKALKELYVPGLRDYVKSHYPLGPVWSATGVTVTAPSKSSKPGAPAAPNLPSSSFASSSSSSSSSSSKQGMAAVFQEISSKPVTAGLKKVTNDMKTKNRTDRGGFVSSGVKEVNKSVPSGAKVGPPKLELVMGRKWVVEYQIGVKNLCIDECDPKQTVYIFGCKDSVLQIKGKVNNITVDKCTKMGVVFTDVVAAFEIVNCSSIEVQCQGAAPTISIDNTAGCQLYLSKDSLGSSITTSKASEVNVMVPSEDPNADLVEHALPHQYIHTHQDGQFVTTPVSHSGGVSECRDYVPKTNSYTESKPGCLTSNNAQKTDSDLGNKAKCLTVNNAPKTDANMEIKTRCLTVNNAQKTNSDTGKKNKTDCLTVNEAQKTDTGMGSKTNCVTTDMSLYYMAALLCIIFAMVVAFMLSS